MSTICQNFYIRCVDYQSFNRCFILVYYMLQIYFSYFIYYFNIMQKKKAKETLINKYKKHRKSVISEDSKKNNVENTSILKSAPMVSPNETT